MLEHELQELVLLVERLSAHALLLQKLECALDGGQGVLDVVCHLARESAQDRETLHSLALRRQRRSDFAHGRAEHQSDRDGAERQGGNAAAEQAKHGEIRDDPGGRDGRRIDRGAHGQIAVEQSKTECGGGHEDGAHQRAESGEVRDRNPECADDVRRGECAADRERG